MPRRRASRSTATAGDVWAPLLALATVARMSESAVEVDAEEASARRPCMYPVPSSMDPVPCMRAEAAASGDCSPTACA